MSAIDVALVALGRAIGKPPGWERIVRQLAPPARFNGEAPRLTPIDDGYLFPVDRGTLIGWSVHFFGAYEPEVRDVIRDRLRAGDIAIDVGANVGWHTFLMAAKVGPTGRVYSFEPNESTRGRLLAGVAANRFANVVVDPRAVASRSGTSGFEAPPAGHTWDGVGRLVVGADARMRVECVTLDDFVAANRIERLGLVKIDVEGWELSVLRGAGHVLRRLRPAIVFEYDPAYVTRCDGSGPELTRVIEEARYELIALHPRQRPTPIDRLPDVGGNFVAVPA